MCQKQYSECRKLFDNYNVIGYTKIKHLVALIERRISMTENEKELIRIIRNSDNPEQALMAATVIILGFLKQHESSEVASVACLREHA